MKICTKCKIEKEESEYSPCSSCKTGRRTICRNCSYLKRSEKKEIYEQRRRERRLDPSYRRKELDLLKVSRITNRAHYLYMSIKERSNRKNIPFNIEERDIIIPELCPVMGTPLTKGKMDQYDWNAPSVDRINPELGYIKGNIMVISRKANTMKNNASKEELIKFSSFYLDYFNN